MKATQLMRKREHITKEEYVRAFGEIRSGDGSLHVSTIAYYMRADPENAEYLKTEALKLVRRTLKNMVTDVGGSSYVLWNRCGYPPSLETVSSLADRVCTYASENFQRAADDTLLIFSCVVCRREECVHALSLSPPPPNAVSRRFTADSANVIKSFYQSTGYHYTTGIELISGLCRDCDRPCRQCGIFLPTGAGLTAESLLFYRENDACLACINSSLIGLKLPELSTKDLREYRKRLLNLKLGVRR